MSEKTYRITVVVLLSLLLVIAGISTFSQFRGRRGNAALMKQGTGEAHALSGEHGMEAFGPNRLWQGQHPYQSQFQPHFQPQLQPQFQPQQDRPFDQPQDPNQGLLENLHELAVQNEAQAKLIRELFGQIEELRGHVLELSEQIERVNGAGSGE